MMTTTVYFFNGALPFKSEAKIVHLNFINSHHFQSKSLGQDYVILHENIKWFFLLKEDKSLNDFFTAISMVSMSTYFVAIVLMLLISTFIGKL